MELLNLPSFEIIRHNRKKDGEKRISIRFAEQPCDSLLDVMNTKRGGFGSYSKITGNQFGWVFPPSAWQNVSHSLGTFDVWQPLQEAFDEAIEESQQLEVEMIA